MLKCARGRRTGLMLLVASGCFQSDFVLYGPPCEDAVECEGAFSERRDDRVCFFPAIDASLGPGYCTLPCDPEMCEPRDGHTLECLTRTTQAGRPLSVCAFVCATDGDCPDRMTCIDDPYGSEDRLCAPSE